MQDLNYLEWIGYIGSVIVAVSLTMTSMVKLRWLNLVGSLIFTIYGVAINAIPVALVNGFIVIINIYYLLKMYTTKDFFTVQRLKPDNEYLRNFVDFYKEEIPKDFPHFQYQTDADSMTLLVLRNMQIAAVFIGKQTEVGVLEIELDFATPQYRDFKTGNYLFNKNKHLFEEAGITQLLVKPFSSSQMRYYPKVGFVPQKDGEWYVKKV